MVHAYVRHTMHSRIQQKRPSTARQPASSPRPAECTCSARRLRCVAPASSVETEVSTLSPSDELLLDSFWRSRGVFDAAQRRKLLDIASQPETSPSASPSGRQNLPSVSATWQLAESTAEVRVWGAVLWRCLLPLTAFQYFATDATAGPIHPGRIYVVVQISGWNSAQRPRNCGRRTSASAVALLSSGAER